MQRPPKRERRRRKNNLEGFVPGFVGGTTFKVLRSGPEDWDNLEGLVRETPRGKREEEGSCAIPKKNVIAKAQGFCAVAGPAAIFLIYKD